MEMHIQKLDNGMSIVDDETAQYFRQNLAATTESAPSDAVVTGTLQKENDLFTAEIRFTASTVTEDCKRSHANAFMAIDLAVAAAKASILRWKDAVSLSA